MSYLSDAFGYIVPKYYHHTNSQFMVIEDKPEMCDLRDNVSFQPPCPIQAQKFPLFEQANSPTVSKQCTFNQLPPTRLPYHPPTNIKYPYVPAFEPMFSSKGDEKNRGRYCSFIDNCDSICFRKH